jgi:hypothetical protein
MWRTAPTDKERATVRDTSMNAHGRWYLRLDRHAISTHRNKKIFRTEGILKIEMAISRSAHFPSLLRTSRQLQKIEQQSAILKAHLHKWMCYKPPKIVNQAIQRLDLFDLSDVNYIVHDLWTVSSSYVLVTKQLSAVLSCNIYRWYISVPAARYPVMIYR